MDKSLVAGAAVANLSPRGAQFLYGYPHVPRCSTGIHDPLLSTALYLTDGANQALFIANDLIYVPKDACQRIRRRLAEATGIPESHVMLTATHTHSGPVTVDVLSGSADPVVPTADPQYLRFMEDRIFQAGCDAHRSARPAEIGLTEAYAQGDQTNRHDPTGPSDPCIPVLVVRDAQQAAPLACMVVYSLHPTVLHEDSTLVSADFPGAVRRHLQENVLGGDCPVLYHTGPSGNQSPRHMLSSNDFLAMEQLGHEIGAAIAERIPKVDYAEWAPIACAQERLQLIPRGMPAVEEAAKGLEQALGRLEQLRREGAPAEIVRTAECDWFGAEETLTLAQAAQDGRLQSAYESCMPCEVQAIQLGPWIFVAWQGEVFVEYALQVKKKHPDVYVISLANGELQGYIVTEKAVRNNRYEAGNSIFDYRSGAVIVEATERIIQRLRSKDYAAPEHALGERSA